MMRNATMRRGAATVLVLVLTVSLQGQVPVAPQGARAAAPAMDTAAAGRFAALALACVHKEYPNKIAHVLESDADALPPRQLTPAFFGCYDWHSAVHGHWLLARLARTYPSAPFAAPARAALARSLTREHLAAELQYVKGPGRVSFERPYGLAWLLQLAAELREWDDADARQWAAAIRPLEQEVAARLKAWLPKMSKPVRSGEHDQTAFSLGLILDWARVAGETELAQIVAARAQAYYGADRQCPTAYEPSGQDFLSPCLAEADLMRRLMAPAAFAGWLRGFLPDIPTNGSAAWLKPEVVTDPTDPKLAHLDGLNLSRAWMLDGIITGLPGTDQRRAALQAAAWSHRAAGLQAVTGEHYEGGHWLGSFAVYLATARGLGR